MDVSILARQPATAAIAGQPEEATTPEDQEETIHGTAAPLFFLNISMVPETAKEGLETGSRGDLPQVGEEGSSPGPRHKRSSIKGTKGGSSEEPEGNLSQVGEEGLHSGPRPTAKVKHSNDDPSNPYHKHMWPLQPQGLSGHRKGTLPHLTVTRHGLEVKDSLVEPTLTPKESPNADEDEGKAFVSDKKEPVFNGAVGPTDEWAVAPLHFVGAQPCICGNYKTNFCSCHQDEEFHIALEPIPTMKEIIGDGDENEEFYDTMEFCPNKDTHEDLFKVSGSINYISACLQAPSMRGDPTPLANTEGLAAPRVTGSISYISAHMRAPVTKEDFKSQEDSEVLVAGLALSSLAALTTGAGQAEPRSPEIGATGLSDFNKIDKNKQVALILYLLQPNNKEDTLLHSLGRCHHLVICILSIDLF